MMTLLLALGPEIPPHAPYGRGVGLVYKFFKRTMIPEVKPELDLRANISGASDELEALQDNRLKNDHPLGILLPRLYTVKLH